MTTSYTITAACTNTFTEARVRYAMTKVLDDLISMASRGFAEYEKVLGWHEEVQHVLVLEAADFFDVKLTRPDGKFAGLRFRVSDDGTIAEDAESGGVNYWTLPAGTKASIVISLRSGAKRYAAAVEYLKRRGWAFNGTTLQDDGSRDRSYSSNGYGLARSKLGSWQ